MKEKRINTPKKALDHFAYKLKNVWQMSKDDKEAFNILSKFVSDKNKQEFNDNQAFGKLYISFYGELLKFYNCTVFDSEPEKAINRIIDTPIEQIIEKFLKKATDQETFIKMIKNDDFDWSMLEPPMTTEEATTNLTKMINNALLS